MRRHSHRRKKTVKWTNGSTRMKAYGIPLDSYTPLDYPDISEIKLYGRKSAAGDIRGRGGDIRTRYFTTSDAKRAVRRIWKRRVRTQIRQQLAALY